MNIHRYRIKFYFDSLFIFAPRIFCINCYQNKFGRLFLPKKRLQFKTIILDVFVWRNYTTSTCIYMFQYIDKKI